MKLTIFLTTALILVGGLVSSQEQPTLSFDISKLTRSSLDPSFSYDNLPNIRLGMATELPARTCYIKFLENENLSDISWLVNRRQLLTDFDPEKAFEDIPTADKPETYLAALATRKQEKLGRSPVFALDVVIDDGKRWAKLLIFPVSVNANGECFFNESLTLTISGRQLLTTDILTSPQGIAPVSNIVSLSPEDPATKYLIVTSSSLVESVRPLAQYRNSLGVRTDVEVIDNILAAYEGCDDAEKLRERLKQFYSDGGEYVLLAGDETQVPIRYAYPSSEWWTPTPEELQICDLYFADLTGDWDTDDDGKWGENYVDDVDLTPELMLGRLPFNTPQEMENYVDKLIDYETNPGNGDLDYLEKAFFVSTDQMRDDYNGGQHAAISSAYPDYFDIDTTHAVELARGDDPAPYNLPADELISTLSSGYGIVNVIAHGDHQAFGVRTAYYNEWPKSYFMTAEGVDPHGNLNSLEANHNISFYYSLACDNGAFDKDQPPFNYPQLNLVQCLLGLKDAGAVGFVANSRWGWVSSSYLIQTTFFDSLFAHPGRPAVCALYDAKAVYPYYRDLVFGMDYFGDPVLKVYTAKPAPLSLSIDDQDENPVVKVSSNENPVAGCAVVVSQSDTILQYGSTDIDGYFTITCDLEADVEYIVAAVKDNYTTKRAEYVTEVVTDVEDGRDLLPAQFGLCQNYPNPFNPTTTIAFELAKNSSVRLVVYNVLGQVVSVLKEEPMSAGIHHVTWDGTDRGGNNVGSGVYLYKLECEDFTEVRKMMLLR